MNNAFLLLHKSYCDQSNGPRYFLPWWKNHLKIKYRFITWKGVCTYSYPCPLATPPRPLLIPYGHLHEPLPRWIQAQVRTSSCSDTLRNDSGSWMRGILYCQPRNRLYFWEEWARFHILSQYNNSPHSIHNCTPYRQSQSIILFIDLWFLP